MARITPLEKPYPPAFEAQMKGLMRGADPLVLFTTLATNERAWSKFTGGSLLDKASPLSPRQRELVIDRSEEHTSELQSLMRISYAVFCLKKKKIKSTSKARE